MLARLRSWWAGRSRAERLIVAVGVPVAAIAALWGARRDRSRAQAAEEGIEAEGGPGTEAAVTTAGRGPAVINAGAPGVDTGQLGSFTEVFTGEIGQLEKSLANLESQFGDTAAERAKREAEQEARFEEGLGDLREEIERSTQRAGENTGRKSDKGRQETQAKSDPDANLREAIRQIFREEQLNQPSAGRLARLVEEVKGGRTLASIREGLETYKRNRPELGIPV